MWPSLQRKAQNAGVAKWLKAQGLGPCHEGVRGFDSRPPHKIKLLHSDSQRGLPKSLTSKFGRNFSFSLATILMTVLEEKHHSILIVENDPVLY